MEFIFDTNIYRNFVRDINLTEISTYVERLCQAENKVGSSSALSIVVAMELIQHLLPDDPCREECYKALCFQAHHTRRYEHNQRLVTCSFYPPMNVILSQFFFNSNSKYFPLYERVVELVFKLTRNQDIANCTKNTDDINAVKTQIFFEKNEFKNNIENFLASINGGTLDWKYFRNNKKERKIFFKNIQPGHIINLLGDALMIRAHQVMGIDELQPEAEAKLEKFIQEYQAALIMNVKLIEKIGHGVENLKDVKDKKWNTLNDVQILFGFLYKRNGDVKKMLVTEEDDIKKACDAAVIGDRVLTFAEYKEMLGQ